MSDPDWWARGLGVLGSASGLVALWGRRDELWRRREKNLEPLRESLAELRPILEAGATPLGVAGLWGITASASLDTLQDCTNRLPDWRLRRRAKRLHSLLIEVRGISSPSSEELRSGDGVRLNPVQKTDISKAIDEVEWIHKRMDRTMRRGAA